jgi:hypothetical protein
MSVDLIALYITLSTECERASDGIYECDEKRFYQDTGFTTFNALSPLLKNGSIGVSTPDDGRTYHITIKEPRH